jgi:hypothetical protein
MSLRRIGVWAALAVFALLACLSVRGAFLGSDRAGEMFTSIPLSVFWAFFVLLVLAGIVTFPRLRRSPALLLAHLGFVFVIAGAFWSSQTGNRLEAALTHKPKVRAGYIGLHEGESTSTVMADSDLKQTAAPLPFSLYLDDFTTEYYPVEGPWMLIAQIPAPPEHAASAGPPYVQVPVEWKLGQTVRVPNTDATVTVLQYLPSARPAYAGASGGVVEVTLPDGSVKTLPATVGATLALDKPKATVRVAQVFGTLRVMGMGEGGQGVQVVDVPGPPQNPAVKVEVENADGTKLTRYAYARMAMHGQEGDQLQFDYKLPQAEGAEAAPDGLPAMQFEVKRGDKTTSGWLIASANTATTEDGVRYVVAPLGDMLASADTPPGQASQTALYLLERLGQVKDWKSTVSVMEEGHPVLTKTIEVNHPLHYGGYRFYQESYRPNDPTFTELSVASDSGVWLIYLGFACVGGAMFWLMWVQQIVSRAGAGKEVPDGE